MVAPVTHHLSWVDYLIYVVMLLASAGIGVYYGLIRKGQTTTEEFFMGGRKLAIFPVAMSIAASYMSAISMIGIPAEIYRFGTIHCWSILSIVLAVSVANHLYTPVFVKLQVTSAFHYLEMRFHRSVRRLASATVALQTIVYMSLVVYAPSLALSQMTGMDVFTAVTITFAVAILYTALGGIKAVIWTDVLQTIIMLLSMVAVIIKGTVDHGGVDAILYDNFQGERIEFFVFDVDPKVRHTVWSVLIGTYFSLGSVFCVSQIFVQRYLSVGSLERARRTASVSVIPLVVLYFVPCYVGLLLYSNYKNCDPMKAKLVSKQDQIVPMFIMESLGNIPGIPGLFVAGVFSASLSTISSGLNSVAIAILEDFIRPLCGPFLSDTRAIIVSKCLPIAIGVVTYSLVFLLMNVHSVTELSASMAGFFGGPMFALFSLGMFVPWTNWIGSLAGVFSGILITLWICTGAIVERANNRFHYIYKPSATDGCPSMYNLTVATDSLLANITVDVFQYPESESLSIYKISYQWYGVVAFFVTWVVAIIVSGAVGFQDPKTLNPDLICNLPDKFFFYLPEKYRKYLDFHVGENLKSTNTRQEEEENSVRLLEERDKIPTACPPA